MSKIIIEKYRCDVCKTEFDNISNFVYPCWTTQSDNGDVEKPYLVDVSIDVCEDCKKKICKLNYRWSEECPIIDYIEGKNEKV